MVYCTYHILVWPKASRVRYWQPSRVRYFGTKLLTNFVANLLGAVLVLKSAVVAIKINVYSDMDFEKDEEDEDNDDDDEDENACDP